MRQKLIDAGVKNLKEFGYPSVDAENILTDQIYSAFFRSMLDDTLSMKPSLKSVIDELLAEIDQTTELSE